MAVLALYVEKKPGFDVEAAGVLAELTDVLHLDGVSGVRIINRYFTEGISEQDFTRCIPIVFSQPQSDIVCRELPAMKGHVFAAQMLPGQFDQRADSAAQCIAFAVGGKRPAVKTARIYCIEGKLCADELERVKKHLINSVESRETSLDIPAALEMSYAPPPPVAVLEGFIKLDEAGLSKFSGKLGLAMDMADLNFCQAYFRDTERRDPTVTEIRVIDTYWSDHCRHTTFLTEIDTLEIECPEIQSAAARYYELREELGRKDRPVTLMDMATIGAKALKSRGLLESLDESEEINACCVKIKVDVDGEDQDWLLMFKNETHNHPTEIEPFGGAATCLGGGIRDPLSGRGYAYQAMRITGAGNILADINDTIEGKLPQRKITQTAAAGYSSYGNQIGISAGLLQEFYHPGFAAKRMECGAVIAAAPASNVVRKIPAPGDVVILLGARTGRDGCGGATGSSKQQSLEQLESYGSQVQRGDAPEERKIQRLFRNAEASRLIKRCNDFGAGGVSVAIGELADGLLINLDSVPVKYPGLDGTELAISESQERMAVVLAAEDAEYFTGLAHAENLEATIVAQVTESPRLVMNWNNQTIVDMSREFLNSNGTAKHIKASIGRIAELPVYPEAAGKEDIMRILTEPNNCCQRGIAEYFDAAAGAGTVIMPFGGLYQLSPAQVMAAKMPAVNTDTCSLMSFGYDPFIAEHSPYHGAVFAVVESIAKLIAAGGSRKGCWLSFQEYFERLHDDPVRWGKPAAALLGALMAQMELGAAAIGGKDSMSGSFEDLDVPPTLISFAVCTAKASRVISPGFITQECGYVYLLAPDYRYNSPLPEMNSLCRVMDLAEDLICRGKAVSARALGAGGTAKALPLMCFGSRVGFRAEKPLTEKPMAGAFLIGASAPIPELASFLLGRTTENYMLTLHDGEQIDLTELEQAWKSVLEPVFPISPGVQGNEIYKPIEYTAAQKRKAPAIKTAKPKVFIPVFPGISCEGATARAFVNAGAEAEAFVIRNLTPADLEASEQEAARRIRQSRIVVFAGGLAGGDEPDGAGKYINAFFRRERIAEAVLELLQNRDGLMLGIAGGFAALLRLGLLPYGDICDVHEESPALVKNANGRHYAVMIHTRVASNLSPWLSKFQPGDMFTLPVSTAERFTASASVLDGLAKAGQIATQYENGGVEGITSPDGRIFGKIAHNERYGENLYRNVPGSTHMDIFSGAVEYSS